MKKFIIIIVSLILSISASAQFVGGDNITSEGAELITSWNGFDKSLSYDKSEQMFVYIHITETPRKNIVGIIESTILSLSLGKTKEEAIKTLNAYKSLIEKLGKTEETEITDVFTNVTYKVFKDTNGIMKNTIFFLGDSVIDNEVKMSQYGNLSLKDIEKMIVGLKKY